jgi:membrane protein
MTQRQATGATILGVGGLLALWSMGGAMQNLMWALNAAYDRDETRGFVRRRLTAFAMVFFALLGFALMFGVLVLGPQLSHWVGSAVGAESLVKIVWWVAEWPLLVGGLLVCFAGVLFLGPNVEHPRWRFLSFGSLTAIVIWLAASGAFGFYVSKFGSYNKTWGALSAVVIMLTWLWLSACALLLGAEINAEAERSRELRQGKPAERELAVRNIPRAPRCGGRAADEPILASEDDQGGRLDRPKLAVREVEGLPGLRLALAHDQHPGPELAIHALALAQGAEDDPLELGLRRPQRVPGEGDEDCEVGAPG